MRAWPSIGALICAAATAYGLCPAPAPGLTPWRLMVLAPLYVLATVAAGMLGARIARTPAAQRFRIATIAVWFAPLAIARVQRSMLAVAPAVMLIAMLLRERRARESPPGRGFRLDMFALADSAPLVRQLPSAILLAALLQMTAATMFAGHVLESVVLSVSATGLLWFCFRRAGIGNRRWPASLMLALATLVTIAGLSRYLQVSPVSASETAAAANPPSTETEAGGDYQGVILLPEELKHTLLVPPLPAMNPRIFSEKRDAPLTIPFYGVYWFFRFPNRRPPANSAMIRGTPDKHGFRSAGRIPLTMEAHQNLGQAIDVGCCADIRVAIRNADPDTGSVAIELILVNSSLAGKPSQTLGVIPVRSVAPATETLTFPVPRVTSIAAFDEITIRFHSRIYRERRSARMAVEKFVLTPHGASR